MHVQYGGVFPAVAKREHAKAIIPLLETVLQEANMLTRTSTPHTIPESISTLLLREEEMLHDIQSNVSMWERPPIDMIAVTSGPGLAPALWVGVNCAKALSMLWDIPVYPINHMEGHIYASVLEKKEDVFVVPTLSLPALALLISGGHTEIIHIEKFGTYRKLGQTRDDAAGEAFDKVARMLGLAYPGGPKISKLAAIARSANLVNDRIPALPRPMIHSQDFDFSFSGIKTATLYLTQTLGTLTEDDKAAIAREFENAVTEVLVYKCKKALEETHAQTLIIGGGVSANTYIREHITELCTKLDVVCFIPDHALSTDNALMIAITAMLKHNTGVRSTPLDLIVADGSLSLESLQ